LLRLKAFNEAHVQERSLAGLQTHCDALRSTKSSLEEEMGTDLLSQLSSDDQHEVDRLNDEIKQVGGTCVFLKSCTCSSES